MSLKGWPDQDKLASGRGEHATIQPVRTQTQALDVKAHSTTYEVEVGAVQAGANTRNSILHNFALGVRKGDVIHFFDNANIGHEATVLAEAGGVITLAEQVPAAPTAGDVIRLLRFKGLEVTAGGGLPSVASFVLDGLTQVVTEDTGTPANNRPLPVKLTGFDGDVSINAANLDLEVQLAHNGVSPDSIQIGDGTDLLAVNPSGSVKIGDGTTDLDINPSGSIKIGNAANDLSVLANGMIKIAGTSGTDFQQGAGNVNAETMRVYLADDQPAIDVAQSGQWDITDITGTVSLPTGASTEATLALALAELASIEADTTAIAVDTTAIAIDTAAINTATAAVAIDTAAINTATAAIALDTAVMAPDISTIAGDTTSLDTKIVQLTLGSQAEAAGLASTLSTRHEAAATPVSVRLSDGAAFTNPQAGRARVLLLTHDHTTPVTTGAYTQLSASTPADINQLHIFDSSGEGLVLATGAAAAEVDQAIIPPGGLSAALDLAIASGTRLSVRALTANTSVGNLLITALS